eukprot:1835997-Rhodomonas_salina.4
MEAQVPHDPRAMRCAVLTYGMQLRQPTVCPSLCPPPLRAGIRLRELAQVSPAIGLRACCAMSGTKIAYGDIGLRDCYGMPGTKIAYGDIGLRDCYAMPGTEIAYGGPRQSVRAR